jgi:hypothetical protein
VTSRLWAYGFGLGLTLLVAAPGLGDPRWDSYPLSTYPMFARPRGRPTLHFAEAVDAKGKRLRVPPELVANQEVMQAAATVKRAVQAGPAAMEPLCERIASRWSDAEHGAAREIALVSATFDPVRYFTRGPEPESRTVHHTCPVRP